MQYRKFLKENWLEIVFALVAFCFSCWLMWHTFATQPGQILIATKAWSDFGAHLPLIRSFSWGKNFPPQYPLFPGEPIRYHFLFYFLVGFLERVGLPLDWALNLPSVLGFFGLLLMIYLVGKLLFNKKSVAFLGVVLFLFNGSLSFLEFFRQHPLSTQTIKQIINNNTFPSFGPYDGKIVSAFWNWNIFTNQRHLAAAYFIVLLLTWFLLRAVKRKKQLTRIEVAFLILLLALLPFFHQVALMAAALVLIFFFLFFPLQRRSFFWLGFLALLLILPQLAYQLGGRLSSFSFRPGYLISSPLTWDKIVVYWFLNLGLGLVFIPLGLVLAPVQARKVFLAFLPLFLLGNFFQFSPEIAANHKLFNLFLIVANLFTAWAVYRLWQKKLLGKLLALIAVFGLTFSGLIDFFPIKNDTLYIFEDAPLDPDIAWIKENTSPDSVFLNSTYIYHPASLAGRKIFLGWPYFAWSTGHNTYQRDRLIREIWAASSKNEACFLLKENKIDIVCLEKDSIDFPINFDFWLNNFSSVYENPRDSFIIYLVESNCH